MIEATAVAHPNVALVKYWGKANIELNIPAAPSLSITLDALTARTHVTRSNKAHDRFFVNGTQRQDEKVAAWLNRLRHHFEVPHLSIESATNFPIQAGLASSAAGFAALCVAINGAIELGLSPSECATWARLGSASAARSMHGGFVGLEPSTCDCVAAPLLSAHAWPLKIIVAITQRDAKQTGSTEGMLRTAATSPFYDAWLASTRQLYLRAVDALAVHSFEELAACTEASCTQMHGVMLSSKPPLIYWNAITQRCIETIRELQSEGMAVTYTVDAGPQMKAICLPDCAETVAASLNEVPGVLDVIQSGIGHKARLVEQSF